MHTGKLTKIISTIGPASDTPEEIEALIKAGVNIFRFNMKHNIPDWHMERIERVQKVADNLGVTIGIMIDLQGPEIRIETPNEESIKLNADDEIYLCTNFGDVFSLGQQKVIRLAHSVVIESLDEGDKFSIDDGFLEFKVVEKLNNKFLKAKILGKGVLKHRKSLNLVGKDVNLPSLIKEDLDKLDMAARTKVDFIALSFVRSKKDVEVLKAEVEKRKLNVKIISKIESQKGLDNIDDIIKISDGIMIARGDLGIETPIEKITYYQKELIIKCREAAKPVIVATQMLQSMIENPLPTRAEAADVANAVYDGTDSIMLSGETATGEHPVKAVKTMQRIAKFNEKVSTCQNFIPKSKDQTYAIVRAAYEMIKDEGGVDVDKVLIATETGYTARVFSSYRPKTPIIALSENKKTVEILSMSYGVIPYLTKFPEDDIINDPDYVKELVSKDILKKGDNVLVIHGKKWKDPGNTNSVMVFRV